MLTGFNYSGGEGSRRNIACSVEGCKFLFTRRWDLKRHLKSLHKDEAWEDDDDEEEVFGVDEEEVFGVDEWVDDEEVLGVDEAL